MYTLNKRRGQKHSGRGHRKHKSGSKGGVGRAGHRTHKILPYVVYKKTNRYIKYITILKKWDLFLKREWIIKVENEFLIRSYKFKAKIISVPFNSYKILGSNHSKLRVV
jgi:hypothetical protein